MALQEMYLYLYLYLYLQFQPASGPKLPLRTSKVLSENKEAQAKNRAGQARGVGDREVVGDHPPVYL